MTLLNALFTRTCARCDAREERVFEDSWTGTELCLDCLLTVGAKITNSPATEGDNLPEVLADDST